MGYTITPFVFWPKVSVSSFLPRLPIDTSIFFNSKSTGGREREQKQQHVGRRQRRYGGRRRSSESSHLRHLSKTIHLSKPIWNPLPKSPSLATASQCDVRKSVSTVGASCCQRYSIAVADVESDENVTEIVVVSKRDHVVDFSDKKRENFQSKFFKISILH